MKRMITFLTCFILLLTQAMGQTRTIKGRITDQAGSAIPSATVSVQGGASTATNDKGDFTINAADGNTLNITAIGFTAISAKISAGKSTYNLRMEKAANVMTEVIVTGAYNTKTTARSTSYNAQVVDNAQLNVVRQTDLNNALAGKVSGLQVRSQSAAALGRNSSIRIGGADGFSTGSDPIYVVDGTILPSMDGVSLDEIESVSVLQGPAAAAQFGSQGANGAIVISLIKASSKDKGFGVNVNLGATFDKVYVLPNYQNSYAGGGLSDLQKYTWKDGDPVEWQALDGKYYHDYSDDASWGPRMVGQEYIPWYAWYGGTKYSYKTAKLLPQPNNAREYFQTGQTLNNSVSFSKATDNFNIRVAYNKQLVKGVIPSSSLNKDILGINSSLDITKKLNLSMSLNYVSSSIYGQIDDDNYSNQTTGSFNQWFHRDLDMGIMKELRGLKTPEGIYGSWNHNNPTSYDPSNPRAFYAGNYWYNFYTYQDLLNQTTHYDRLYGNISLAYKLTKDFTLRGTYRKQQNTVWSEQKFSSDLALSGTQTTGNEPRNKGYYATSDSYSNRENIEFMLLFSHKFKDFSIDGNIGSDFFNWLSKSNGGQTQDGLIVPNLYALNNSVTFSTSNVFNGRVQERYNAIYGNATVGYKNLLFANATLRKDWFSTLPVANNDVLSKSFGASFVFSDLTRDALPWLSYGKIRGSWGEIPQALGTDNLTFGAYRYPGGDYGIAPQWNGYALQTTPDQLVDPNIRGAVKTRKELGLELSFLRRRLGITATLWDGTSKNFPFAVTVNGASGYTSQLINVGKISKQGLDLQLNAKLVVIPNFKWEINGTWSYLIKNDVDSIAPGITTTSNIQGVWGSTLPYLVMSSHKRWGQIYGNGMKRINGKPVVNSNGYVNDPNVFFGSVLPNYTGGIQNTFNIYRDFVVNINIDYQIGGKYVSLSDQWGSFSGLTARTATINDKGNPIRDDVSLGGGVHLVGVDATGKDMDLYMNAQDYFHNLYNNKTFDPYVYDLTFVKLRELSIGYYLPIKKFGWDKSVRSAMISFSARNPVLIYSQTRDFDPSEISLATGETGQYPGVRGWGFNLRVGF
ncbi:MAG: SusC/RagA family TonB-linked outer membrane protein [Bacteroidetes bacterium]|nr:SusC/RagA family TonB-linked outer membrane protein [Bacteroidota bacterium]